MSFSANYIQDHHNPVYTVSFPFPLKHYMEEQLRSNKCYLGNLVVALELQCAGVVGCCYGGNCQLVVAGEVVGVHSNILAEVGIGVLVEGSQGVMVEGVMVESMLVDEQDQQEMSWGAEGIAGRTVGHTLVMNGQCII